MIIDEIVVVVTAFVARHLFVLSLVGHYGKSYYNSTVKIRLDNLHLTNTCTDFG